MNEDVLDTIDRITERGKALQWSTERGWDMPQRNIF